MAFVEEATGLPKSTDTFLRDFCAKGGTVILLSKALSPTTMPNIQGMSVGEVAALWAGATVRQTGGGSTYVVPDDRGEALVYTPGGGRGILMRHPTLGAQCIPTTALLLFPGFLEGVTLSGAAFSSHGLAPLEDEMEAAGHLLAGEHDEWPHRPCGPASCLRSQAGVPGSACLSVV